MISINNNNNNNNNDYIIQGTILLVSVILFAIMSNFIL